MFIPLRDLNPRTHFPLVTVLIIAANVAVFLFQLTLVPQAQHALALLAGAIPAEITNWVDVGPADLVPPPFTILTSLFLHGGFLHIIGNMWFLWLFGDNVEDRLGRFRFLLFYLVSGVCGALAQCYLAPQSLVPMIGASGAVAGVLGAYFVLYPHSRVVTLVAIPFLWPVIPIRAWIFLGLWFVGQFFVDGGSGIAWMAHVGGFLVGLGLVRLLIPRRDQVIVDAEYIPPPRRG